MINALLLFALCLPAAALPQKDDRNCRDHPLFTRMPDSWIRGCSEKEFDAQEFLVAKDKKQSLEGRVWKLSYYPQADAKSKPSEVQILRNFENAAKRIGGTLVYAEKGRETLRIAKDGQEFWVQVSAEFTGKYGLTILRKGGMAQDVAANADAFADSLRSTGHAAVYGILFDTGKSSLKPESAAAVAEIAKLLKQQPALRLHVVGHTDNVGGAEANLKLSQARAEAVLDELVRAHGVAAARLRPFGNGPFAPVASNGAEPGRAQNRRVELVQQ
jgi:outer membrane protein OmpA-like peptidoglycan-associated protein